MASIPEHKRPDRYSRETSVSSNSSELSTVSTTDSEAPLLPNKLPLAPHLTTTLPLAPNRSRRCRYASILVCVALILSIGSIAMSILMYLGWLPTHGQIRPADPTDLRLCLPCQELVITPFPQRDSKILLLEFEFRNKTMICCAKTPQQHTVFVDMLVRREVKKQAVVATRKEERRQMPAVPSPGREVGAHLLVGLQTAGAVSETDDETNYKSDQLRGWVKDRLPAYIRGLHLTDGRIIIQHSGLYLIYSQIYFKVKPNPTGYPPVLLGHRVYRYSVTLPNDGKEELLQSAQSCCGGRWGGGKVRSRTRMYVHTSSVVGVFHLTTRDEVYVTVSHSGLIYRDPNRSYFGLYKL